MQPGKMTFKPTGADFKLPGNNTVTRDWDIKVNGAVVGSIDSTIRDLNGDLSNPGYSVTVSASINGVTQTFYKNSGTFSNRSAREARENRSRYISAAKEWAERAISAHVSKEPHHMTKDEFQAAAKAQALVNHGRKWNVTLGNYSAFSDAESAEAALADVHHGAVNNALYLNCPDAPQLDIKPSMPALIVLADYPDLVAEYRVVAAIAA